MLASKHLTNLKKYPTLTSPCRLVKMESLISAVAPRSPAPGKKLSDVDFRSGAPLEQLSAQVSELVRLEQGEFGDQTALEVHTAKDFIFNMLGMSTEQIIHKMMVFSPNAHLIITLWIVYILKLFQTADGIVTIYYEQFDREVQWRVWL